jgi:hypothetical protein
MAGCENPVADLIDVALQFRIAVNTEQRGNLLAGLLAQLGFLLPGITQVAPFTGCGDYVRRAAEKDNRKQQKRNCPQHRPNMIEISILHPPPPFGSRRFQLTIAGAPMILYE